MFEEPKKTNSPWAVEKGTPVGDEIFKEEVFNNVRDFIKEFSSENDIIYAVEEGEDGYSISPESGDFEQLRKYIGTVVYHANEMLKDHNNKSQIIAQEGQGGAIVIKAAESNL
jgi:hypothetical protein